MTFCAAARLFSGLSTFNIVMIFTMTMTMTFTKATLWPRVAWPRAWPRVAWQAGGVVVAADTVAADTVVAADRVTAAGTDSELV
jgi:hypothetical protein